MATFEPKDRTSGELYELLVSAVEPRPIALVSTISSEGVPNLAPFSFFTIASIDPVILGFCPIRGESSADDDGRKDTLTNILNNGECVIHITSFAMRDDIKIVSSRWPSNVDEFDKCNLTPTPSSVVAPPRAKEAGVAFECKLDQYLSWGDHPLAGSLCLVEVLKVHVEDECLIGGSISRDALDPIGRLGGADYVRTKDGVFDL